MIFKKTSVRLRDDLDYTFKTKCDFYDITPQEIITELIIRFTEGELDDLLQVPPVVSPKVKNVLQLRQLKIRRDS